MNAAWLISVHFLRMLIHPRDFPWISIGLNSCVERLVPASRASVEILAENWVIGIKTKEWVGNV